MSRRREFDDAAGDAAVFAAHHGEPFQREGRPGTVSQQVLERLTIDTLLETKERDPDAGVNRRPTVLTSEHVEDAEFGSFSMHLWFRTPSMPKATRIQDRGNSGPYLQNRYELQICDSFGQDCQPGHFGGIYSAQAPSVDMCLPPLAWQTYYVDFTAAAFAGEKKLSNARVTVRHNGVLIIDDLELKGLTPGGARIEAPGRSPLMLQYHGCPVHFRNIWVVEK